MTGYVHAMTDHDVELERLRLLEHRYDPGTVRRFAELGSLAGARCLEVGAGAGSVTRWLSEAVGPAGHVLAVDLDPRFLTGSQGSNVEVRRHDIVAGRLDERGFDLVHCRALLIHVEEPERALANMVAALRPGGRILVEDADMVTMMAADEEHPAAASFDRVVAAVMRAQGELGTFRPHFARNLPALARRAGLIGCREEAGASLRWGTSPEAEFMRRSCEPVLHLLRDTSRIDADDVIGWESALADPPFCFYDALSIAVWGVKA